MQQTQDDIDSKFYHACQIADARLQVAESLSLPLAIGWSVAIQLKWGSWIVTVAAGLCIFFFCAHRWKMESEKAWKAFENRPMLDT